MIQINNHKNCKFRVRRHTSKHYTTRLKRYFQSVSVNKMFASFVYNNAFIHGARGFFCPYMCTKNCNEMHRSVLVLYSVLYTIGIESWMLLQTSYILNKMNFTYYKMHSTRYIQERLPYDFTKKRHSVV